MKHFSFFKHQWRFSLALVIASGLATFLVVQIVVAQSVPWSGPTQSPPQGNPPGFIFNQQTETQTGANFNIDGTGLAGIFQGNLILGNIISATDRFCFDFGGSEEDCVSAWNAGGFWDIVTNSYIFNTNSSVTSGTDPSGAREFRVYPPTSNEGVKVQVYNANDWIQLQSDNENSISRLMWGDDAEDKFIISHWDNAVGASTDVMSFIPLNPILGAQVGIGTTTPSVDLKLHVEGKVGATEYCDNNGLNCVLPGDLAGGSDLWAASGSNIYNTNSGNVGIGTNAPSYPLEIQKTGTTRAQVALYSAGNEPTDFFFGSNGQKNRWSISSRALSENYALSFWRWNDDDNNFYRTMIMDADTGNVGIGSLWPDAPAARLEVRDATAGTAVLQITDDAQNPELRLKYGGGAADHWAFYVEQASDSFRLWGPNPNGNKITVLQSGNVGISNDNPGARLSIKDTGTAFVNIGTLSGFPAYSGISFSPSSGQVTTGNYSLLGEGSNTFINRPSNGRIYFRENNSLSNQVIIEGIIDEGGIDLSGNVGIGVANTDLPIKARLSVKGGPNTGFANIGQISGSSSASGIAFGQASAQVTSNNASLSGSGLDTFVNSPNGSIFLRTNGSGITSEQVVIVPGGNVGIGTASPGSKLTVVGNVDISNSLAIATTSSDGRLYVNGGSSGWTGASARNFRTADGIIFENDIDAVFLIQSPSTKTGSIWFGDDAAETPGRVRYVHSTDVLELWANNNARFYIDSAGDTGVATSSPFAKLSVTNTGVNPSFIVEDSTSPDATPFIIDASGNVGISNDNPGARLSIKDTGTAFVNIGTLSGFPAYSGISFSPSSGQVTTGNYSLLGEGSNTFINRSSGGKIFFRENNATQMVIDAGGNVGIGTTNPTAKLYVAGDLEVTGNKSFVQGHPTDPTKEIRYVSLEGGESGTYVRGSGQLINGQAIVDLPEHFGLVTSENGLTSQVTPTSDVAGLYVAEKSTRRIIVREVSGGTSNATFDYLVQGVRQGYEDYQVIREKTAQDQTFDSFSEGIGAAVQAEPAIDQETPAQVPPPGIEQASEQFENQAEPASKPKWWQGVLNFFQRTDK